jgi:uncharacterized protein
LSWFPVLGEVRRHASSERLRVTAGAWHDGEMARLRIDRLTRAPGRLTRANDARVLAARCYRADRLGARLAGLLFTPDLVADEALWLEPCSSVHTFGLRASIAVIFVDADGIVLRVLDPMPRWRAASCRGARAVIELPAGGVPDLRPGDRVQLAAVEHEPAEG